MTADNGDAVGSSSADRAPVLLACYAVERFVRDRLIVGPPSQLTPLMAERAGVFVSIKKRGELRGCIGTFEPTARNVAAEIIQNAISSATRDPRFPPVQESELQFLAYSVDVLSPPQPVDDETDLDPRRYGVIVMRGSRRGLLLPNLAGVDSVGQQLAIAKLKAGINKDEVVDIMRFEVRRCT